MSYDQDMMIDARFSFHNTHVEGMPIFMQRDPQLNALNKQPYQYCAPLLDTLPTQTPGIYTLGGGRQVGKSTLLKQWMLKLLKAGVLPQAIVFFTGELIDDHHALLYLLQQQIAQMPSDHIQYIIIDEITYIKDWDKAIKYLADAGLLGHVVLVLTGSDRALMQAARIRFPGRRGKANKVDFHLYPLSFYEVLKLTQAVGDIDHVLSDEKHMNASIMALLNEHFLRYLQHGGYLTAINEFAQTGSLSMATFVTYSDWIRGDMQKRGKQEPYLREILKAVVKRYNTQITWHALAKDLSIDHPATVSDYLLLLSSMDAVFIQSALLEDKLAAAPKKARKVIFTDPFIYHAMVAWLYGEADPYNKQVLPAIRDSERCAHLVEACVTAHYRRYYETYYIKAEGEVDIAYIDDDKFWPIEIKWTNQLRKKDLKQIAKYANARIWAKEGYTQEILGIKTEFLPWALAQLKDIS